MADLSLPRIGLRAVGDWGKPRRRQKSTPAENRQEPPRPSLLGKVKDVGLGGLAAVGNLLDLPGSAVRDVLAGKNPVDQLLTPFSSENRTTGRDLLRQSGLAGRKDTIGNWWGGLATEIALDPTTYLTFGASALTKGGRVAKNAGLLDDAARLASQAAGRKVGPRVAGMTGSLGKLMQAGGQDAAQAAGTAAKGLGVSVADVADQPLRGLVGVGLPFQRPSFVLGTGKAAQKVAGALDKAGMVAKASAPGRAFRGLLDYTVKGHFKQRAQELAERITKGEDAARSSAYMKAAEYKSQMADAYQSAKDLWGDDLKRMYPDEDAGLKAFELVDRVTRLTGEMSASASGGVPKAAKAAQQVLPASLKQPSPDTLQKWHDSIEQAKRHNVNLHAEIEGMGGLAGWVQNHVPRYGTGKGSKLTSRIAPTAHESMLARTPEIRDVPAEIVNHMAESGATRGQNAAAHIEQTYGNYLNPDYGQVKDALGNVVTPGSKENHAKALAAYLQGKDQSAVFKGYTPDDQLRYLTGGELVRSSLKVIHQTVAENLSDQGVNVQRLFTEAGMHDGYAMQHISKITGKPVDELARMGVPVDVAEAILAHTKMETLPEWQQTIGNAVDTVNKWFKSAVTLPFPSFWARNFTGGQANNLLSGLIHNPGEAAEYVDAFRQAAKLVKNPDETLMSELIANRVFDPRSLGMGVESTTENVKSMSSRILSGDKLANPFDVKGSFRASQQSVAETGKLGKVADTARAVYGTAEETGARVSHVVEFMNRVPMYLYLKSKGWSPAEAAKKVLELQVDYACVDEKTEILTSEGWKNFRDIKVGDTVLSICPETREICWDVLEAVNVFPSPGTLIHIKNTRMDAMVTGNHRWLCQGTGVSGGHWTLRWNNHNKTHFASTAEILETKKQVLMAGGEPNHFREDPVYSDEFVELVGWYVTEGHLTSNKTGIYVSQSEKHNRKYLERIKALSAHFSQKGCTSTVYAPRDNGWGPIVTVYFGKGIGNEVRDVCPGKQLTPEFLLSLTRKQAENLINTLIAGDGGWTQKKDCHRPRCYWTQKDIGRCDSFQMLCAMMGVRTMLAPVADSGTNRIAIYQTEHVYSTSLKWQSVHHEGVVWCPTTSNGTWMARRNGSVYWTGNSLAPFEKTFMRRLAPFYSWQRRTAPVVFKQLLERPGGPTGQTIKAINRARKPDEVTPDYVAETAAIPTEGLPLIGSPPEGTNRYITGLGLPLEAPLQYLGGGARGAMLEGLSQLNPLVKGPLEWATGQSFFQRDPGGGRAIEDLDPTIGRLIANVRGKDRPTYVPRWVEAIASNTPATRFLTSARQATDPRKGAAARAVNLLTGMRVTDVSPQAQDAALQDKANAMLKQYPEAREFSSIYVPKERLAEMSPSRREGVQTLLNINRTLAERAKIAAAKRKAQKK